MNESISAESFTHFKNKYVFFAAPRTFTVVFAMIRPLLTQVTLNKLKVLGCDRDEWTAALLEDIDADQLPVHYGGTMTDPDGNPKCPSKASTITFFLLNNTPTSRSNKLHDKYIASNRSILIFIRIFTDKGFCIRMTFNLHIVKVNQISLDGVL